MASRIRPLHGGPSTIYAPLAAPWGLPITARQPLSFNLYFWGSLELHQHHSAHGLIQALSPVEPVTLVRPHAARRAARFFIERFPGTTMYAVKANPSPDLLRLLWDSGVTHYDVASIDGVRLVARALPVRKSAE